MKYKINKKTHNLSSYNAMTLFKYSTHTTTCLTGVWLILLPLKRDWSSCEIYPVSLYCNFWLLEYEMIFKMKLVYENNCSSDMHKTRSSNLDRKLWETDKYALRMIARELLWSTIFGVDSTTRIYPSSSVRHV